MHLAADLGPYGSRRDNAVANRLRCPLIFTGSPYVVEPGRVLTQQGSPY